MQTRLTDTFGIRHPVLCAPMALITGGRLAASVSEAGGLGILGGGYAGVLGGEPDLKQELAHVKGHKFGIGFITWALARAPHVLDEALEHSPAAVYLSFGEPQPFAERIRRSGAKLICQVQSLRHVDQAIDAGAEAIVAQGAEAGGHGGLRSTLPFVPEVADHLARRMPNTLLLAAGGIADGRGLAAALMLGADGVVCGTRFLASEEAFTPRWHTTERHAPAATTPCARRQLTPCAAFPGRMSSHTEFSRTSSPSSGRTVRPMRLLRSGVSPSFTLRQGQEKILICTPWARANVLALFTIAPARRVSSREWWKRRESCLHAAQSSISLSARLTPVCSGRPQADAADADR